jgi:uncharacterized protein
LQVRFLFTSALLSDCAVKEPLPKVPQVPARQVAEELQAAIRQAAHLLPTQGPITVFVHHNTLHAFENLPFAEAVVQAQRKLGCEPFQSEESFRKALKHGRIRVDDLRAVLVEELGEAADGWIGSLGTRYELRLAMLQHPLRIGPEAEIRWFLEEADALFRFQEEASGAAREAIVEATRHWVLRHLLGANPPKERHTAAAAAELLTQFGGSPEEGWGPSIWETFSLHLLWRVVATSVERLPGTVTDKKPYVRSRDLILDATGYDVDLWVHEELIRFCAAFLDQGYATWKLPGREQGLLRAFCQVMRAMPPIAAWLRPLDSELARLESTEFDALSSIQHSLTEAGITADAREEFLEQTLLALRGWASMLRQMETNGEWTARPAPPGSLEEFLAVRLILDRLAATYAAKECLGSDKVLRELSERYDGRKQDPVAFSVLQRQMHVFQLAQLRGWSPIDLARLTEREWSRLIWEIEDFTETERRRVYHLAFERRYRNQTLDAIAEFSKRQPVRMATQRAAGGPAYQVVCCIDDREESLRRHLEEVDPEAETFGVAGFFGVAMYYRGATEAHYRPLCPVNVQPRHYVLEEPVYTLQGTSRRQAQARLRVGRLSHRLHMETRTALGGMVTGFLGSLASLPMVMRILFPRAAAQMGGLIDRVVNPPLTQLRLERLTADPGQQDDAIGYTVEEMTSIVEGGLQAIGLTQGMGPLVLIVGHGSVSLNNPHEAAYDCGACGGGRGGPNARAFAQMANDHRVRRILAERGLNIPEEVYFVGAFHNTCDDSVAFYDLERLPAAKRHLFDRVRSSLEEARRRDAHERCRRFHSAPTSLSPDAALRHVEGRSQDLSQVRPEYCHATNAVCIVGRRERTRGLFLDRRAFLTSYDPTRDDSEDTILAKLLGAVIPVCAGINLEYYFSAVDPVRYGCGSKLPHNLAALLGVMEGAASDLRTGLSQQMVEIHEPMRILFVVETTPAAMDRILHENDAVGRLVRNDWVQLALLDPDSPGLALYRRGHYEPYHPESRELPTAEVSADWYRGWRDHLGFAEIREGAPRNQQAARGVLP